MYLKQHLDQQVHSYFYFMSFYVKLKGKLKLGKIYSLPSIIIYYYLLMNLFIYYLVFSIANTFCFTKYLKCRHILATCKIHPEFCRGGGFPLTYQGIMNELPWYLQKTMGNESPSSFFFHKYLSTYKWYELHFLDFS